MKRRLPCQCIRKLVTVIRSFRGICYTRNNIPLNIFRGLPFNSNNPTLPTRQIFASNNDVVCGSTWNNHAVRSDIRGLHLYVYADTLRAVHSDMRRHALQRTKRPLSLTTRWWWRFEPSASSASHAPSAKTRKCSKTLCLLKQKLSVDTKSSNTSKALDLFCPWSNEPLFSRQLDVGMGTQSCIQMPWKEWSKTLLNAFLDCGLGSVPRRCAFSSRSSESTQSLRTLPRHLICFAHEAMNHCFQGNWL